MSYYKKFIFILKSETAKLRNMTRADRLWYIWEYYKIHIAVILFVLVFSISMLYHLVCPDQVYLQNITVNLTTGNGIEPEPLSDDFREAMGLSQRDVIQSSPQYLTLERETLAEDYQTFQVIQVLVAARELDILFMDGEALPELSRWIVYADLEEILPPDLWSTVKEHVIYIEDPESGRSFPAAIDISTNPVIEKCGYLSDTVVLSIAANAPHLEHSINVIRYLFGTDVIR